MIARARNTYVSRGNLRALCTTRPLRKPAVEIEEIDAQIRAAAEQLAALRKARLSKAAADRTKTKEDENVSKFMHSQMAQPKKPSKA